MCGEDLGEAGAGAVEAGLAGAGCDALGAGDVGEGHAVDVVQDDDAALGFGQAVEGCGEPGAVEGAGGGGLGVVGAGVEGVVERAAGDERSDGTTAVAVDEQAVDDGGGPGGEAGGAGGVEAVQARPEVGPGGLVGVFGLGVEAGAQGPHARTELLHELGAGGGVATVDGAEEGGLGHTDSRTGGVVVHAAVVGWVPRKL